MKNRAALFLAIILLPSFSLCQKDKIYYTLESAVKAGPDSVYRLDLSKQKLQTFPEEILKFVNLRELNLEKNKLSELPGSFRFDDLRVLNIGKNKFTKFPLVICQNPTIRELSVAKNDISEIPECISFVKNLIKLDLWFNPIENLPEGLTQLRNLRVLDLRNISFDNDFQKKWTEKLPWVKIEFDLGCDCGP